MNLEEALANAEAELAAAERALGRAQETVEALRIEKRGLEYALARHQQRDRPADVSRIERAVVAGMNMALDTMARTAAIEKVLEDSDVPLSPTEVTNRLHAAGRDDDPHHVSAALAYLNSKGRVASRGRGQWVHQSWVKEVVPSNGRSSAVTAEEES